MTRLRLLAALVAAALGSAAPAQQTGTPGWLDGLHLTASGSAAWVENLSRTSFEPTRQDAATYDFTLAGSIPRQLAPSLLLVGSGELDSLTVPDHELAGSFTATGHLALQRKFGLGPQAWVLQASGGAAYKSARLAADRGWTLDAGLQLSKRLRSNLRVAASARWLEHDAASATFDLNQRSYGLEAQWDIDEHWTLSGSATRLQGDIVANAAWFVWAQAISGGFGPTVLNYYTSRPWSVTNLYGAGWVSYNVEADVDLWSVALAYAWSDRTTLELRKSAAYVVNHIGIAYPSSTWSLGFTHRF